MTGVLTGGGMKSVFAALKSAPITLKHASEEARLRAKRFVTISREGGAGGHTIAHLLLARLKEFDPDEPEWALWDRQIAEKVATDHHISREVVEALEDSGRNWFQDFLAGLSFEGDETEARVYQRVAATVRVVAQRGRTIIVGRGGVFITRGMIGGVHLRLVAPFDHRVENMARQMNLRHDAAVEYVHNLDKHRKAFFRRYWPQELMGPDAFTLTVNTATVDEARIVEGILPFILPDVCTTRVLRKAEA